MSSTEGGGGGAGGGAGATAAAPTPVLGVAVTPGLEADTPFGRGVVVAVRDDGFIQVLLPWGTAFLFIGAMQVLVPTEHVAEAKAAAVEAAEARAAAAAAEAKGAGGAPAATAAQAQPRKGSWLGRAAGKVAGAVTGAVSASARGVVGAGKYVGNKTVQAYHGVDVVPVAGHIKGVAHMIVPGHQGEGAAIFNKATGGAVYGAQATGRAMSAMPVIGHGKGAVLLVVGHKEEGQAALQLANKSSVAVGKAGYKALDGVPVVGHVKGLAHLAAGDKEGGNRALISATRSTAVVGAAAAVVASGGTVLAVAGVGVAAGVAYDAAHTGVDSKIHHEYRPHGHVEFGTKVATGKAGAIDVLAETVSVLGDAGGAGAAAGSSSAAGFATAVANSSLNQAANGAAMSMGVTSAVVAGQAATGSSEEKAKKVGSTVVDSYKVANALSSLST